jgi:hypothetical protein
MASGPFSELLRLPVRLNGIELAWPVATVLGEGGELVGLEVQCRDGNRRFLPAGAAEIRADEIRVSSALVFLDERELSWYRRRSARSPTG